MLTSQYQAGPLLQVLPHFLTSKSLLWCSFHWLYCLNTLWILLYPLPSICCFFFDFPLFSYFFSFLIITITFSLIALFHLLFVHAFSLVFIDVTLSKFFLCSSTSCMLFLWFSFVFCLFPFVHFFFDFLVVFYPLINAFWFFSWKFLAAFMLCDCCVLLS